MTGFKNFILRGNLVELAVAFIMATRVRSGGHGHRRLIMGLIGKAGGHARLQQLHSPAGCSSASGSPP